MATYNVPDIFFIVFVLLSTVIVCLSQETFSSMTEMRSLVNSESVLLDGLEEYLQNEQVRLAQLRR